MLSLVEALEKSKRIYIKGTVLINFEVAEMQEDGRRIMLYTKNKEYWIGSIEVAEIKDYELMPMREYVGLKF